MPESIGEGRAALSARAIPHMTLSNGDASSQTGPPPPMPHYISTEGRAILRFSVEGNAICMSRFSMVPSFTLAKVHQLF